VRRGLRDPLARGIRAEEFLHRRLRLERAARLGERVHERELRRGKLRLERERAAERCDGLVRAAELQEAAAELLVAFRVVRLVGGQSGEQGLRLVAASLAVQRRAEERGQVGLAGELAKRIAAERLRERGVAGPEEAERALECRADEANVFDGSIPGSWTRPS